MGMIRVSDEVEARLKGVADGRSMSVTIEKLLDGGETRGAGVDTSYFDKKFEELKDLIEDTTVDRVAGGNRRKSSSSSSIPVDYSVIRDLFYDFLEEDSPEWTCKEAARGAAEASDLDCRNWKTDGTLIFDESSANNGQRLDWVKITPRVKEFLISKGVDI